MKLLDLSGTSSENFKHGDLNVAAFGFKGFLQLPLGFHIEEDEMSRLKLRGAASYEVCFECIRIAPFLIKKSVF